MKSILLAAAALIATPAIAQMQPADTAGQTAPGTEMQSTDTMGTTAADPAMQAPATGGTMSTSGTMNTTGSAAGSAAAGPGGYMPSGPALQGTPAPGATVRFQQAPTPDVAFPPPAPKQSYPICKKGQYDGCMQPGGK